tara:strand:+ start:2003 stop:2200 length:198 start_codon:yes stop_codon:yes gene_type:complete
MSWNYQLMKHTEPDHTVWYAVHEFYTANTYTKFPVDVTGDDEEDIVRMLEHMLEDIKKHGVKDYE